MSVIRDTLIDELDRLQRMEKAYSAKIQGLPKGKIVTKNIKGRSYEYLQFREANKIISSYIKKNDIEELQGRIKERISYEKTLKDIRAEIKFINKALKLR